MSSESGTPRGLGLGLVLLSGVLLLVVIAGSALVIAPLAVFAAQGTNPAATGGGGTCTALPPTTGGAAGACSVVAWAQAIADHLHMCGADPELGTPNFDTCYTSPPAADAMPTAVITYLGQHYPEAQSAWVSGNFQCVSLVIAAYGLGGVPLPTTSDAVQFWGNYRLRDQWLAIPTAE